MCRLATGADLVPPPAGPHRRARRDRRHRRRRLRPGSRSPTTTAAGATSSSRGCAISACAVDVDEIGNVVGTWPPERTDAPVMTGSHIDTVATGGRYDGTLGVLAGLEVIETVIAAGIETKHPLAVAFFTDEEGSRFAPDMLGSLVFAGGMPLEDALTIRATDGAVLGDELLRIGYAGPEPCPARPPHAYVELHIEQGPVLEAEGVTIGAVTGVQGISWTELTITGQSNHAGTTPMAMRHDAGYVAAEIAVFGASWPPSRAAAGRDRRADRAAPEPRERRRGAGDADRRPAQHRRRRARRSRAATVRALRRARAQ